MSIHQEVWDTLSAVDVSKHVEKKNGMNYLSWAWAWGTLMEYYPESSYHILGHTTFDDGSCEVSVLLKVQKGEESFERIMWLPVMDYKNQAVKNPDSVAINKAKMRCLVKAIGMVGLGHYLYAGEDLPDLTRALRTSIDVIKESIANDDHSTGAEAWYELSKEEKEALWVAQSKGGPFTAQERKVIKECFPSYHPERNK